MDRAGRSALLASAPLCLITDAGSALEQLLETVAAACDAGCRLVQLRDKSCSAADLFRRAGALREVTAARGAALIVNDRADVALAVDADGVHLPGDGLDPREARALLGGARLLGRSVHSASEIEELRARGADELLDYFQFGPVYETPSKARFGPPQGLRKLADAARAADGGPALIAVGGISRERVPALLEAGALGVAVISAVMKAADPRAATIELLGAIRGGPARP